MAQWLITFARALLEDQSCIFIIYACGSKTACNAVSEGTHGFFWHPWALYSDMHTQHTLNKYLKNKTKHSFHSLFHKRTSKLVVQLNLRSQNLKVKGWKMHSRLISSRRLRSEESDKCASSLGVCEKWRGVGVNDTHGAWGPRSEPREVWCRHLSKLGCFRRTLGKKIKKEVSGDIFSEFWSPVYLNIKTKEVSKVVKSLLPVRDTQDIKPITFYHHNTLACWPIYQPSRDNAPSGPVRVPCCPVAKWKPPLGKSENPCSCPWIENGFWQFTAFLSTLPSSCVPLSPLSFLPSYLSPNFSCIPFSHHPSATPSWPMSV